MTLDDTGQPSVDRLAALEAALRECRVIVADELETFIENYSEYRGDEKVLVRQSLTGWELTELERMEHAIASTDAALDAASRLTGPASDRTAPNTDPNPDKAVATTPTPDQGALERARIALRRGAKPGNPIPTCRCFKVDMARNCVDVCEEAAEHVAAALTAAASEARAAAIESAYSDAEQAAVNPMLCDEGDGPLDLQRKIGKAIQFRKRLAIAPPSPQGDRQ